MEAFIHSVTVEDNAAYFDSLVIQTDNELKAKTRYFDQTVGAFIESASQNESIFSEVLANFRFIVGAYNGS